MDQEKIGKLIAKLRKSKGITQSELGDMVGVGFRAVSKWENGITVPDISIINDLSKILGISADELLKGELNNDNASPKSNFNFKKLLYLIPFILIIVLSVITININKNKTEVYKLETEDNQYYIEGDIIFRNTNMTIDINKLIFHNSLLNEIKIKNYQYEIYADNELLVGYGYLTTEKMISSPISISDWSNNFTLNYNNKTINGKNKIIQNGLKFKITFLNEQNEEIYQNIELSLLEVK